MRTVAVLIFCGLGYLTLGIAPVGASADSSLATVVTPKSALVRGGSATVCLRLHVDARFKARLRGRAVTGRFAQRGDGTHCAQLRKGKDLKRGLNYLSVSTRSGEREDFDLIELLAARRKANYLVVRGAPQRPTREIPVVRARLRGVPRHLNARLNGHPVRREFLSGAGTTKPAHLGPDDGLRYGKNRLVVRAHDERGVFDREVRSFRVLRRAPLVAAGPQRWTTAGSRVRLDASKSRPAGRGNELRFRWSIARAPSGSKARIKNRHAAKPRFVPDEVGRYKLRLEVIETRGAGNRAHAKPGAKGALVADDTAQVLSALPTPPMGVPITTIPGGGAPGIDFAGERYPASGSNGPGDWVQLLVLDRQTLAVNQQVSRVYDYSEDPQDLSDAIGVLDSGDLAIVTGGGRPQPNLDTNHWNTLKYIYSRLGGETDSKQIDPAFKAGNWSLIGVPGLDPGQGFNSPQLATIEAPDTFGSLSGFLQLDYNFPPNFGFAFGDYVSFDTNATRQTGGQNTIKVGDASYDSQALSGNQSGFQVLVLNAGTLFPVPNGNQTFVTNDSPTQQNVAGVNAMNEFVSQWTPNQTLFLIQSIGSPTPLTNEYTQDLAGGALKAIGASPDVINEVPAQNGGYSLVTPSGAIDTHVAQEAWAIPEDPTSKPPVRLVGTLSRNRQAGFYASNAGRIGSIEQDMLAIAYGDSQPWPYTDPSDSGHYAALQYISQQLGQRFGFGYTNDIRINYWAVADSGHQLGQDLPEIFYPNPPTGCPTTDTDNHGNAFSPAQFCDVLLQLEQEASWVDQIQTLVDNYTDQMQSALIGGSSNLASTASKVIDELGLNDGTGVQDASLLGDFRTGAQLLAILASLSGDLSAGLFQGLFGAFILMGEVANSPEGAPLVEEIDAEAGALGSEMKSNLQSSIKALDHAGDLLVSDYAKLSQAGLLAANAQDGWALSKSALDEVPGALANGTQQYFYRQLMGKLYGLWDLAPGTVPPGSGEIPQIDSDPYLYECEWTTAGETEYGPTVFTPTGNPHANLPPDAWRSTLIGFYPNAYRRPYAIAGNLSIDHTDEYNNTVIATDPFPLMPRQALVSSLFTPIDQGGVGFIKPEFFDQVFELQQLRCYGDQDREDEAGPVGD
jgi:hypothetical protein